MAWDRERTIPAERPPLVGEVSGKFLRCRVVSAAHTLGGNLGFLDCSLHFFFQVAPQLYSRGRANPVPDPILLTKSGSAGNRTRTSGSVIRNSNHTHTHTHTHTQFLQYNTWLPWFPESVTLSAPWCIEVSREPELKWRTRLSMKCESHGSKIARRFESDNQVEAWGKQSNSSTIANHSKTHWTNCMFIRLEYVRAG
jgi:hypothetical protein